MIVGHTLMNDVECMVNAFYQQETEIPKYYPTKLIDLQKLYKMIYPKSKYSSLAHVCQQVLGKELCKAQTLTNWRKRPLRKNQIHYAALDAYAVLKVYEKFKD